MISSAETTANLGSLVQEQGLQVLENNHGTFLNKKIEIYPIANLVYSANEDQILGWLASQYGFFLKNNLSPLVDPQDQWRQECVDLDREKWREGNH